MPSHKIGKSYSFDQLRGAYRADQPTDDDPHYLLFRGNEVLALCLRYRFNPEPGEVWVGDDSVVAEWGAKLSALIGKQTLPVYYSPKGRSFYEYKGHHVIAGETNDPNELANRKGPVPLSRVLFIRAIHESKL